METFTEIFQEQENLSRPEKLGELVKLGEHTYVMGRNHKDIYKGTITRKGDNYEIRTKQESGKRFQFMVMDNKDGTVTIGARPTNATGRRLELFTVRGDRSTNSTKNKC